MDVQQQSLVRVMLRPVGTPLPLGFIGLFLATTAFGCLQLDWLPTEQGRMIAISVLAFTMPAQLFAAVFGFLARDPVAGTGMAILAGTWAAAGTVTLTGAAGATSSGLGVVLLAAAVALLVPAVTATTKLVAAGVMLLSSLRFAVTGIAELTGAAGWTTAAGWVGLLLAAAALYAAFGFELEAARHRTVLPLLRRHGGQAAVDAPLGAQLQHLPHEPGIRRQL